MSNLQCYKVTCVDSNNVQYSVGVCTINEDIAKKHAVESLLEGKHVKVKALKCEKVDFI